MKVIQIKILCILDSSKNLLIKSPFLSNSQFAYSLFVELKSYIFSQIHNSLND